MARFVKRCDFRTLYVSGEDDQNGWEGVVPGWYWGRCEVDPEDPEQFGFVGSTTGEFMTREACDSDMNETLAGMD